MAHWVPSLTSVFGKSPRHAGGPAILCGGPAILCGGVGECTSVTSSTVHEFTGPLPPCEVEMLGVPSPTSSKMLQKSYRCRNRSDTVSSFFCLRSMTRSRVTNHSSTEGLFCAFSVAQPEVLLLAGNDHSSWRSARQCQHGIVGADLTAKGQARTWLPRAVFSSSFMRGRSDSSPEGESVSQSVSQSDSQSVSQSVGQSVSQSINQSINQSILGITA